MPIKLSDLPDHLQEQVTAELAQPVSAKPQAKRVSDDPQWRAFRKRLTATGWEVVDANVCFIKDGRKFHPFNWDKDRGVNWHQYRDGGLPE